jgi:hypothetical protein
MHRNIPPHSFFIIAHAAGLIKLILCCTGYVLKKLIALQAQSPARPPSRNFPLPQLLFYGKIKVHFIFTSIYYLGWRGFG